MDIEKKNKLDAKLREMLEENKQTDARQGKPKMQSGTGNIIRRRKGEQDKRISL